jgi:hypothetical protein
MSSLLEEMEPDVEVNVFSTKKGTVKITWGYIDNPYIFQCNFIIVVETGKVIRGNDIRGNYLPPNVTNNDIFNEHKDEIEAQVQIQINKFK